LANDLVTPFKTHHNVAQPRPGWHKQARCTLRSPHTSAYASIRQHTSAYVSIRQHTSAYGGHKQTRCVLRPSIRQHTSAYVSIRPSMRQHTSAYVSLRGTERHTSAACPPHVACRILLLPQQMSKACSRARSHNDSIRPHTSAYVRIRPHTSAHVRIRQHSSAT